MDLTTVNYLDTTLRDGSHAIDHELTPETVREVVAALAAANVRYIEIGHGAGLGGSSALQGFAKYDNETLLDAAKPRAAGATLISLLVPGIGIMDDLRSAVDHGLGGVRIAVHVTEADVGLQHIKLSRELGLVTFGFLMMTHMAEPGVILEQARMMADAGAQVVYLADSAGNMVSADVRARFEAIASRLAVPLGFHAHNNFGLAMANAVEAVESGATWIDGSLGGLGAGAGNLPGEVFTTVAGRFGIEVGVNGRSMMDSAENDVRPIMKTPQVMDRTSLVIGTAGVYSSFMRKALKVADAYHLDARDILLEAGRRKAVGGQEDMLELIAAELSAPLRPEDTA
jgi:4-hydroxy 2-oxovalerate aldolase